LEGHSGAVTSVSWSSDGRRIVSSSLDGSVRIWDSDTYQSIGSPIYSGHMADRVHAAAFSPDGHLVVSAGSQPNLRLWDVEDTIRDPLSSNCPPIWNISYTSDGRSV
ncbi:WD40 repeat-like protein, partial [Exidia glandulosa HHB12029]